MLGAYGRATGIDGITGQLLKYDVICFHRRSVLVGNRIRKRNGSMDKYMRNVSGGMLAGKM